MRIFLLSKNIILSKAFFIFFFVILGIISIGTAISSLFWTIDGDNIGLLYAAFLTDKFHLLPYHDFFYFQLPFVHFYYVLLLKIFGYSYLGFRIANIMFLLAVLSASFLLFKKISIRVGVSGIITFSLIYFIGRTYLSLQRDYVLLLPIILSILYSYSYSNRKMNSKSLFLGFCVALSVSIKPHAVIVFPVLYAFHVLNNLEKDLPNYSFKYLVKQLFFSKHLLFTALGFLIPVLLTVFYLWFTDSIKSFWEIQTNFTRLYRDSKMLLEVNPSDGSMFHRIIRFHSYRPFLLPAAIGLYISIFRSNLSRQQRLLVYEMAFLSIFFFLYVLIAAKFFWYHWLPFAYFAIFLASTCFIEQKNSNHRFNPFFEIIPLLIIFFTIGYQICRQPFGKIYIEELTGKSTEYYAPYPFYEDINTAAEYLKTNLKQGDKVLPLDNTATAMHSMYLAKAELASYYITESLFFMGEEEFPNSEYFRRIHIDYMEKFRAEKPRFVIDFTGGNIFADLQQILDTDYNKLTLNHGFIYQRKNE